MTKHYFKLKASFEASLGIVAGAGSAAAAAAAAGKDAAAAASAASSGEHYCRLRTVWIASKQVAS